MTDKQTVYRILDWDKHFENNRSRTLKRLDWVPVPTKQDGDGYTELVGHKDGAAHLGCWLAIVQVAARCHPRGTLLRSSGGAVQGTPMPHDCDSLSRMTRLPSETLSEAMQRLCIIGWLECLTLTATGLMTIRHDDGRHVPDERQGDAEKRPYMEWNGREEKGREQHTCAAKTPQPPTAAKPRERGPIWDTLCELFGLHPETDAECARLGKTVSELRQKEANPATPASIRLVYGWCKAKDWDAGFKHHAIAGNWDEAHKGGGGAVPTVTYGVSRAEQAELDRDFAENGTKLQREYDERVAKRAAMREAAGDGAKS